MCVILAFFDYYKMALTDARMIVGWFCLCSLGLLYALLMFNNFLFCKEIWDKKKAKQKIN